MQQSPRIVTLDFETYFSKDYSLSRRDTTLESYIRDPRFQTLMMSYAINEGPVHCAVGREQVNEALKSLALWEKGTITVAHNAPVEGSIIEWRYGMKINALVCTMAMARGIGLDRLTRVALKDLAEYFNKRGQIEGFKGSELDNMKGKRLEDFTPEQLQDAITYCNTDVELTRKIFLLLYPYMFRGSLDAIDMTMKMFTRPMIKLDVAKLEVYKQKVIDDKAMLMQIFSQKSGYTVDQIDGVIRSPKKFPEFFKKVTGLDLPTKISDARTKTFRKKLLEVGEGTPEAEILKSKTDGLVLDERGVYTVYAPATAKDDLDFLDLLEHHDPLVVAAVEAKMANSSSLHESRAQRLIEAGARGLLPVTLVYASAHTGRYGGGGGINLQNLPSRGDTTLRESMTAPEGYSFVVADSSQVEARILAYVAGQADVLEIFRTGGDVYSHMGARIYNIPYETIVEWRGKPLEGLTPEEVDLVKRCKIARTVGKEAVLASGYQMSGRAFAARLLAQKTMLTPLEGAIEDEEEAMLYHEAEAQRINTIYRDTNFHIVAFWRRAQSVIKELAVGGQGWFGGPHNNLFYYGQRFLFGEYVPAVMLPNGFWINFPHLKCGLNEETGYEEYTYRAVDKGHWRTFYLYGGKLTENLIQALAFAVLQGQALDMRSRGLPIMLNVHDEYAVCVEEQHKEQVATIMEHCMNQVPDYLQGCPLTCESGHGYNYSEV